jgi:hypothetical protein
MARDGGELASVFASVQEGRRGEERGRTTVIWPVEGGPASNDVDGNHGRYSPDLTTFCCRGRAKGVTGGPQVQ